MQGSAESLGLEVGAPGAYRKAHREVRGQAVAPFSHPPIENYKSHTLL